MTNHKLLKIMALIAVIIFVVVYAMTHFRSVGIEVPELFDGRIISETSSESETSWSDNNATVITESTTEYYDENGSVKYILNTKIDFHSTIINDNIVRSYCNCSAQYNNQVLTHIFQNDITGANTNMTEEFVTNTIKEPAKECAAECIKFGASRFFGIK